MPVAIKINNRPFLSYSERMINVINTRPRRHPKFKFCQTTIQSFFYISFLTHKKKFPARRIHLQAGNSFITIYMVKGKITSCRPYRPFPEQPSAFLVCLLSFLR